MGTLLQTDIADLMAMTLPELGRNKWTQIATTLQDHIAMNQILRSERVGFDSGDSIQWNVMVSDSGAAKNVGLYEEDDLNVGDVMQLASLDWRHSQTHWAIERREVAMNRTPARIVELMKIRRADAMIALAKLMESNFWGKPSSPTDKLTPHGVDYWMVRGNTDGFNTTLPAGGFTDVAGLVPSTYDQWANWADTYAAVSQEDLIRKMRKAFVFCDFKHPVPIPDYNAGDRFGFYTNYNVVGRMEELLRDQNDNLGNDLASKDGKTLFRGSPINWVPELESDTADPVYGINWGVFMPVFLRGEYLVEDGPRVADGHHTVSRVFVDLTYNFCCKDRRRLFVLDTAGTAV